MKDRKQQAKTRLVSLSCALYLTRCIHFRCHQLIYDLVSVCVLWKMRRLVWSVKCPWISMHFCSEISTIIAIFNKLTPSHGCLCFCRAAAGAAAAEVVIGKMFTAQNIHLIVKHYDVKNTWCQIENTQQPIHQFI